MKLSYWPDGIMVLGCLSIYLMMTNAGVLHESWCISRPHIGFRRVLLHVTPPNRMSPAPADCWGPVSEQGQKSGIRLVPHLRAVDSHLRL